MTNEEIAKKEIEKRLKMLECSYEMYEKSKVDMLKRRKNDVDKFGNKKFSDDATEEDMSILENMEQDVLDQYAQLGGDVETLKERVAKKRKTINRSKLEEIMKKMSVEEDMKSYAAKISEDGYVTVETEKEKPVKKETTEDVKYNQPLMDYNMGHNQVFDTVPLPSNGEAYKSKLASLPVGYLTAYDENIIVSPNLYRDGTFLDYIIKNKLMTNKISVDDLLVGDRDAIILYLRSSSYGPEFPVTATDGETGKQFESVVDLTKLKYKEFTLKGDEDGYFDFQLPVSKDNIKFKFMTIGDVRKLEKMEKEETVGLKKSSLNSLVAQMTDFANDSDIQPMDKKKVTDSIKVVKDYIETITEEEVLFTHSITNKLIMSVVNINGITDRKFITNYVMGMNVRDSSALRKYITEHEPGIDFNIEVERPESLGGGSVKMFLTLDQFIFLNIA